MSFTEQTELHISSRLPIVGRRLILILKVPQTVIKTTWVLDLVALKTDGVPNTHALLNIINTANVCLELKSRRAFMKYLICSCRLWELKWQFLWICLPTVIGWNVFLIPSAILYCATKSRTVWWHLIHSNKTLKIKKKAKTKMMCSDMDQIS